MTAKWKADRAPLQPSAIIVALFSGLGLCALIYADSSFQFALSFMLIQVFNRGAGNSCHGDDPALAWEFRELSMRNLFPRFINDQSGLTAIEYGLIAILVATTLLQMGKAGAELFGANLSATFQSIAAAF